MRSRSRRVTVSTMVMALAVAVSAPFLGCGDVVEQAGDTVDQVKQDVAQATKQQATDYVQGVTSPMQSVVEARADLAAAEAAGKVGEPQMRRFATDVSQAASDLSAVAPPPGLDSVQQQLVTDLEQWAQTATAQAAQGLPGAQTVLGAAPEIGAWADAIALLCQAAGIEQPAWLDSAQNLDEVAQ